MSTKMRILIVAIGVLFAILLISRAVGWIQWYKASSTANSPVFKPGDMMLATSFKLPGRYDFICFRSEKDELENGIRTYRLCGMEGDTINIQNGMLFVNGRSVDDSLPLAHDYLLAIDQLDMLPAEEIISEGFQQVSFDTVRVTLSDEFVRRSQIPARRKVDGIWEKNDYMTARYSKNWNKDQFGPLCIPPGKYFVLGDNRDNANDSRYFGLVDQSEWVGTVIGR